MITHASFNRWAFILLSMLVATLAVAELKPIRPKESSLIGTWIGHDDFGIEYVSLKLETNKTGWLATSFSGTSAELTRIEHWIISETEIICKVSSEQFAEGMTSLRVKLFPLRCEIQYGKAKRAFFLLNQEGFLKRLEELEKAVENGRKDSKK